MQQYYIKNASNIVSRIRFKTQFAEPPTQSNSCFFDPAADEARSGQSPILWQRQCLWLASFNLVKSLDVPTVPFRAMVQGYLHNRVSMVSVCCVPNIFLLIIYTLIFLSFCHHSGFLTCTDLPIIDLAHPVVALAERTIVFAGLSHLADADSTLASASVTAQLPPWDAAPELRVSPGQPAQRTTQTAPAEDSKENRLWSKPGAAAQSR